MAKHLLSSEEFSDTAQAVEHFRKNEGPKLQEYLEKRQDLFYSNLTISHDHLSLNTVVRIHAYMRVNCNNHKNLYLVVYRSQRKVQVHSDDDGRFSNEKRGAFLKNLLILDKCAVHGIFTKICSVNPVIG